MIRSEIAAYTDDFSGDGVQQISIPWMLDVAKAIQVLDLVHAGPLSENWPLLFNAKNQIEAVFDQSIYRPHLRISREKGQSLFNVIVKTIGTNPSLDQKIEEYDVWQIKSARDAFQLVFFSELSTLPAFLVSEKESHDLSILISLGERMFPANLLSKAPETKSDAREAGKALAYELGTACGFHTFRVAESVLKRYWDHVSAGQDRPNLETLGNYAKELERKKFGEEKVWEAIKQMTKLHRNPIIHPDVILTVEEAIGIIGIARSVVGAMLTVLPDIEPTTDLRLAE